MKTRYTCTSFKVWAICIFGILTVVFSSTTIIHAQMGWTQVGGSQNVFDNNDYNQIYALCSDKKGNVYAIGDFVDSSGYEYVAKWNGKVWSELGTGKNALNALDGIYSIAIDTIGNIYTGLGDSSGQYGYVYKWNGTNWIKIGGGKNGFTFNGYVWTLTCDRSGNVYAASYLPDSSGYHNVYKWNGTNWTTLGIGTNALNANSFIYSLTFDKIGNIYAAGLFYDTLGYNYVAKWNDTSWSELGIQSSPLNYGGINSIIVDASDNIYATSSDYNLGFQYFVSKWDGKSWSELGTGTNVLNANHLIYSLAFDKSGNLYAAGGFKDSAGYFYVAEWNGASWHEVGNGYGGLYANGDINAITLDASEKVYAGGRFTDVTGYVYIAKYDTCTLTSVTPSVVINSSTTTFCSADYYNNYVQITASSKSAGIAPLYTWKVGNTVLQAGYSSTFNYMLTYSDSIGVVVTSQGGCVNPDTAQSNKIYVNSLPVTPGPTISITASNIVITPGTPVTFTATVNNAGTDPLFEWYKNNILVYSINNYTTYTDYNLHGGDVITCMVSTYNCTPYPNAWSNEIIIKPINQDSINHDSSQLQLINNNYFVSMYPSPAYKYITINMNKSSIEGRIRITDIIGRIVYEQPLMLAVNNIDVSTWMNGMYLYTIYENTYDANNYLASGRFIVIK